jgi:hypothetical protein
MLIKVISAIALALLAFVVYVVTRPPAFRYQRTLPIAAAPEVLFGWINDLRRFQEWNPYAKLDPHCHITYSGPTSGVGSSYSWKGNSQVGEGTMTIIESRPGQLVRARMEFRKPFAGTHTAEFTLRPEGGKTVVTWSLTGENNLVGKLMSVCIDCDKLAGGEFEKGLATLSILASQR